MSRKIATVCLWLLFSGSAVGQKNTVERIIEGIDSILFGEPCEAPSARDYEIASEPEPEGPTQGFWAHVRRLNRIQAKRRVQQYPVCLAEQERKLIELKTELVKAQIEALKNDTRKPSTIKPSTIKPSTIKPSTKPSGDADYRVGLGLVLDFENIRKLIEQCTGLGRLEVIRGPLESATDLEHLRATLESYGIVDFYGCPSGVTGYGIVELIEVSKQGIVTEEDFADAPLEKEPMYDARARNKTRGGSWYRVKVEFDGDEIIVHFQDGLVPRQIRLTLDDEEIYDPSDIDARDRERGNRWTIDVDGL